MSGLPRGIVVIWLDEHIGRPENNRHLKTAFSTTIDPTNPEPVNVMDGMNRLLFDNICSTHFQFGSPCELQAFADMESCLRCIRDHLNEDKRIFLIVSDYIGTIFLPHIFDQCPQAFYNSNGEPPISIYIFTSTIYGMLDHWLLDYIDYVYVFDHEADLLCRLTRDIANYLCTTGKKLLNQGALVDTHQALIYFEWARTLFLRANSIDFFQLTDFTTELDDLIRQAEEKIENGPDSVKNSEYSQSDMKNELHENIFIYHSTEFRDKVAELLSMLNHLTIEDKILFNNAHEFLTKLQRESCTNKHCSPIVLLSNNGDRTKILNELSSMPSVYRIYVLSPLEHTLVAKNDRRALLENFHKVQNIYFDAKTLALEWTAERALECEKIADLCSENGSSDLARMYYEKTMTLNERLTTFIKKI